ncbi:MAG: hypothetical protein VXW32_05305 [Myxococcota bacterium]|nr:hypothetical protein [Myxococcota bacterium]
MSTKKKLLLAALVLVVVGGLFGYKKVKSMLRGGDIEDVAVHVPDDVWLFFANRGAGEQSFEFSRMGEIMEEAGPRTTHYLNEIREAATPILGFDPLSSKNWQNTGMSFFRPLGVAVAGTGLEDIHLLYFLPVGSEDTLLSTLEAVFSNLDARIETETVSDHEVHVVKGLGGFFPIAVHYAVHEGYLIGSVGMEGSFDPLAVHERIWSLSAEDSLMGDAGFNNRIAAVGSTWHSLTYTSAQTMELAAGGLVEVAGMYGMDLEALPIGSSAGMGTTHLTDDRFRYTGAQRMATGLVDPLWFDGVKGSDTLGSKLPGDAIMAGRLSMNLPQMWASSMAEDMGAEAFLTQLLADGLNIEIERDLVNNLSGHISMAMFAPNVEKMVPEAVVYTALKNPEPVATLVDNGCRILSLWGARLEHDENGVWCSDGMMLFFGVAHDHLMLGSSEDANQYRVLEGGGYLDAMSSSAKAGMRGGAPIFLTVDTNAVMALADKEMETVEMMAGFKPSLPPSIPLDALSLSVDMVTSSPETEIEAQSGLTPYDSRIQIQGDFTDGGLQDWLSVNLESVVVWMENAAGDNATGSMDAGPAAAGGLNATLQEISSWQIMGAEELGEPYSACGSEEKAMALVHGGDPNTVYTNDDRTCFENIGWSPSSGDTAFWTTVEGPDGTPTAFTVHGVQRDTSGNTTIETLRHPEAL